MSAFGARSRAPLTQPRCSEFAEETGAVPVAVDVTSREPSEPHYLPHDELHISGRAVKGGSVCLRVVGRATRRLDQLHVLRMEVEAQKDDATCAAQDTLNLADLSLVLDLFVERRILDELFNSPNSSASAPNSIPSPDCHGRSPTEP